MPLFSDLASVLVVGPLRLAVIAFLIGLSGVALAFSTDYGSHNPLAWVALFVVVISFILGFVSIIWGWLSIYRRIAPLMSNRSNSSFKSRRSASAA